MTRTKSRLTLMAMFLGLAAGSSALASKQYPGTGKCGTLQLVSGSDTNSFNNMDLCAFLTGTSSYAWDPVHNTCNVIVNSGNYYYTATSGSSGTCLAQSGAPSGSIVLSTYEQNWNDLGRKLWRRLLL